MKFAGFIITYHRPKELLETIRKVFEQSYPPEFLWIIDNSSNSETEEAISALKNDKIKYHQMGYNAGPAGAAAKGLEVCFEDGADWIYWGDDDDPPFPNDCFERLIRLSSKAEKIGILGAVGHRFNKDKGVIKKIPLYQIEKADFVHVDSIAGNMSMLVSKDLIEEGILPDASLFFGFEELDFCLRAKEAGFEILVDSSLFLFLKKFYKREKMQSTTYTKKSNLNREYYSLRNLLFIADKFSYAKMKRSLILKWIVKSFYGFRFGISYGTKNFRLIWLALFHYFKGNMGETIKTRD